jgi:hypothetical protein
MNATAAANAARAAARADTRLAHRHANALANDTDVAREYAEDAARENASPADWDRLVMQLTAAMHRASQLQMSIDTAWPARAPTGAPALKHALVR